MTDDERLAEELIIKQQTLQLEKDKFEYAKELNFRTRVSGAYMAGARTLLIANATAMIFSISYREPIVKTFTAPIANFEFYAFVVGFVSTIFTYIDALNVSAWRDADVKKDTFGKDGTASALPVLVSFAALALALLIPIIQLSAPGDLARIQEWIARHLTH